MTAETSPAGNPAGRGGLFANGFALVNAIARFVETRLELVAKESKSAIIQLLALAAMIVGTILMFALGYLFLLSAAIAGLAAVTGIAWTWIALMAAGLHFVLAMVCMLIARVMLTKPPFRETAAELKKDREWLRNLDATTRPTI